MNKASSKSLVKANAAITRVYVYRLYLKKIYIFVGNIMKKIQNAGSQRLFD